MHMMSISPDISVRPPPAIRVSLAPAGGVIVRVEIDWIVFPTTCTFDRSDKRSDCPSKMRSRSGPPPEAPLVQRPQRG
jgi:hypothetical protein